VYRVASMGFLTDVLGDGTQLSQVTYGDLLSQRRGWSGVFVMVVVIFYEQANIPGPIVGNFREYI